MNFVYGTYREIVDLFSFFRNGVLSELAEAWWIIGVLNVDDDGDTADGDCRIGSFRVGSGDREDVFLFCFVVQLA